MSLDEYELIGIWSAGAGYYATFSDRVMVFKPDGIGRVEFRTVYSNSIDYFRWKIVAPGVLELTGDRPSFHYSAVSYIVSEKERPPGTDEWMMVLQIALPDPYPSMLGLVSRDLTGWQEPYSPPSSG